MKYEYILRTSQKKPSKKPYVYNYGSTKNIRISISTNDFWIELTRSKSFTIEEIKKERAFRDALKKAFLLCLIQNGKMPNDVVTVVENGKAFQLNGTDEPLVYSVCSRGLDRKMSPFWKQDECIKTILGTTKTGAGRLDAAFYSLILAKSKTYEVEKFIYLWMSMNGLYGYMSETAEGHLQSKKEKKWLKHEFAQLKFFTMFYGMKYRQPGDNDKNTVRYQLEKILMSIQPKDIFDFVEAIKTNNESNPYVHDIKAYLQSCADISNSDPYAYLLIWLSYQIRCKYFHSEKTLPLLSFENESPLPVLRILNLILESFLDDELYKWFISDQKDTVFTPKIENMSQNCICNNNGHLTSCIYNGAELR